MVLQSPALEVVEVWVIEMELHNQVEAVVEVDMVQVQAQLLVDLELLEKEMMVV